MSRDTIETPEALDASKASEGVVQAFSEAFSNLMSGRGDEPAWMRRRREAAWEEFASLPMPTTNDESWRRTDIRSLELEPFAGPLGERGSYTPVDAKPRGAALPIPRGRAKENVIVHADGTAVYVRLSEALARQGVIFTDLDTAARRHPDKLEAYYLNGKIPDGAKKFAALHGAFCTAGT